MLESAELFVDPAFLEGAADLDLLAVERAGAGLSLLELLFDLRERLSGILPAFELGLSNGVRYRAQEGRDLNTTAVRKTPKEVTSIRGDERQKETKQSEQRETIRKGEVEKVVKTG